MTLWTDFIRALEDTIRRESVFDGGNLWLVISQQPCRVSLSSASCPSFGVDVEFCPFSRRIECVFRPARTVRAFELRHWTSFAALRGTGVPRIRPRQLADSLIDLVCFGGRDAAPQRAPVLYQK